MRPEHINQLGLCHSHHDIISSELVSTPTLGFTWGLAPCRWKQFCLRCAHHQHDLVHCSIPKRLTLFQEQWQVPTRKVYLLASVACHRSVYGVSLRAPYLNATSVKRGFPGLRSQESDLPLVKSLFQMTFFHRVLNRDRCLMYTLCISKTKKREE